MTNQSVEVMVAYLFRIISSQFHQVVGIITLRNRGRTILTLSIKRCRWQILFQEKAMTSLQTVSCITTWARVMQNVRL